LARVARVTIRITISANLLRPRSDATPAPPGWVMLAACPAPPWAEERAQGGTTQQSCRPEGVRRAAGVAGATSSARTARRLDPFLPNGSAGGRRQDGREGRHG